MEISLIIFMKISRKFKQFHKSQIIANVVTRIHRCWNFMICHPFIAL